MTETKNERQVLTDIADRSTWGPGPWDGEPDRVLWVDPATEVQCLARRGPAGAWCGYVGVPEGHPWFGLPYWGDEGEADLSDVSVHGAVTYAEICDDDPIKGVCHVPDGDHDNLYWVGFDCAHSGDVMPRSELNFGDPDASYKTLDYVTAEIERLAVQAAAARG